jgi:hypothetical protein
MRVSPLDLRSSPSVCLLKHILSDKVVTLITPDQSTYQEGKIVKAGTSPLNLHLLRRVGLSTLLLSSSCERSEGVVSHSGEPLATRTPRRRVPASLARSSQLYRDQP